jgi:hypothetical protein
MLKRQVLASHCQFPGFYDVFIHMQLLRPPSRPSGMIHWLNCTRGKESRRTVTEGESGRSSLLPYTGRIWEVLPASLHRENLGGPPCFLTERESGRSSLLPYTGRIWEVLPASLHRENLEGPPCLVCSKWQFYTEDGGVWTRKTKGRCTPWPYLLGTNFFFSVKI